MVDELESTEWVKGVTVFTLMIISYSHLYVLPYMYFQIVYVYV